jgi:hypothetical protein
MESSFHSLTPSLPLFCNCQFWRLDWTQFQAHIAAGWRPETRLFTSNYCSLLCLVFWLCLSKPLCTDHTENTAYIVDEACLPPRCLAIYILLSRALACAGMCLPGRCLAMGLRVKIFWWLRNNDWNRNIASSPDTQSSKPEYPKSTFARKRAHR